MNVDSPASEQEYHIAVLVFPTFQALDLFGPLDILNVLSRKHKLKLSIIANTLSPVPTRPGTPFSQSIVPTHTYDSLPSEHIDAVLVPGGLGTRPAANDHSALHNFLRQIYPSLDYLLTVCTGSALVAQAGLLDGRRATSNKKSWAWVIEQGPKVDWVHKARWVEDGNIWTSSGVAAGMDMVLAWAAKVWGEKDATETANFIEYEWHQDSHWDPFADMWPASVEK